MLLIACLFVTGVAVLENEPVLPDAMWCALLPVLVALIFVRVRAAPLLALAAGYFWAAFVAHMQMGAWGSVAAPVEGRDVEVTGTVRGLPDVDSRRTRFEFRVLDSTHAPLAGARLRLSWYGVEAAPSPRSVWPGSIWPGSVWRLTVRIRRPRGWRNPGGSDYEGRLFADRIAATGYVRAGEVVGSAPAFSLARVDMVRADLARWIRSALDGYDSEDLVRALAIGDRSGLSEDRWRTLRVTGIAHLMAISGLHVGMAAGTAYWLALRVWTLVPRAALLVPAPQLAGVAAMLAALAYALLAGLALPTQRALLMLGVLFASRLARRCVPHSHSLALALIAVLVVDPHSVRAPGFWLSFVAVAAIVMALATRPALDVRTVSGRLRMVVTVQIAVTVGLAPVTLAVFAEQSVVSPFVNALVIPLVGIIVVPVVLLGLLAGAVHPPAGALLLAVAAGGLDTLWPLIKWIAGHAVMLRAPGEIGNWPLAAAVVGVLIMLAPRGLAPRWLGIVWMLPMFAMRPAPVEEGAWRMTVLDVGHGLSVVVETARRVLVYDTGPRVGSRLDAAALAVLPYLAARGHDSIDRVVLSHGDADHVGGYRRLAGTVPITVTIANGAVGPHEPDLPCEAGTEWNWDGISFEVLYPFPERTGFDNAHSCVIRIAGSGGSVLLTGDIESGSERALVTRSGPRLAADVLVVPHHGSRTSSTRPFLASVAPSIGIFSASEHGRFRLPHPEVVSRYVDAGIATYSTSRCGAVTVESDVAGGPRIIRVEREIGRRYWHVPDRPCRGEP
ncbi:MAG: DNA internalization-related competence protein ComEC/Rec2 [Thiotrichales bacterium]|nr:DNA internalization-related competence protein ComEC/Rec2 [Thiotrichales bacterium]